MKNYKRTVSLLLCLIMLLSAVGITNLIPRAKASGTTYTVVACSDFQNPNGDSPGQTTVNNILAQIKQDYPTADGLLCCGDYNYSSTSSTSLSSSGLAAIKSTIKSNYSNLTDDDIVLIQGNHDPAATTGLATSGAHDNDGYGVFVINEDDYMWYNNNLTTIQNTVSNLQTYLNAKLSAGYTAPVFVISHLPLHYTMRTKNDGDGQYANLIFNVLNKAAEDGLNIVFLYGHDHSNGWDDYLGGAAVYLKKGDKINIAQSSKTTFKEETLNFTYMNAGFTGYYENHNGADDTLTMTVFQFDDDEMTVKRYDANGEHNLKSAGKTNSYKNETGYSPNTDVYTSPQTVILRDTNPRVTIAGTSTTNQGGAALLTANAFNFEPTSYTWTSSDPSIASVGNSSDNMVSIIGAGVGSADITVTATDGENTATATYRVTISANSAVAYTRVTATSQIESGKEYLIFFNNTKDFLLPQAALVTSPKGLTLEDSNDLPGPDVIVGDYTDKEWVLTATGTNNRWYLSGGGQNVQVTRSGSYGSYTYPVQFTASTGSALTIGGSADNFTFSGAAASSSSTTVYFRYNADNNYINGVNSSSSAAKFYIYERYEPEEAEDADWTTITEPETKTIFALVDAPTAGENYVICNTNAATTGGHAIKLNSTTNNRAIADQSVTVKKADDISDVPYIDNPAETAQWTWTSSSTLQNVSSTNRYLRNNSGTLQTSSTTTTWSYSSSNHRLSNSSRYVRYNSGWSASTTTASVYFYEETEIPVSEGSYALLDGTQTYTYNVSTKTSSAIMDEIRSNITVLTNTEASAEGATETQDYTITGTVDPDTIGLYPLTVNYGGKSLGQIYVNIVPSAASVMDAVIGSDHGEVTEGAKLADPCGSTITVTYSDGTTEEVPVTLNMLQGEFDAKTPGVYENLVVVYNGRILESNYTLTVNEKYYNDYPEYPDEGSVRVEKNLSTNPPPYLETGVARIELSATGVPKKEGLDIMIILDTSSSMGDSVDGTTRIAVLRSTLNNLITDMKKPNEDGSDPDIDIAIIDFNAYSYIDETNDHLYGTTTRGGTGTQARILLPFTDINETTFNASSVTTASGTNYDSAFQRAYDMIAAKQAQNAENGEERKTTILFMSDGAAFQYNYFGAQSGNTIGQSDARYWNNWLQGTVDKTATYWTNSPSSHKEEYYNEEGKHWMAEAIKGDPDEMYKVIRTDAPAADDYITYVPGLGAEIYSVGFCLADDKEITTDSMHSTLDKIATAEDGIHNLYADSAAELESSFDVFEQATRIAGTGAYFTDQMGDDFKLQTASYVTRASDSVQVSLNPMPTITVKQYDLYNASDVNGTTVTTSMVGTRKPGNPTAIETVTFNADGTQAYSDKIGNGATGIMSDGIISAQTFWYNNNEEARTITLADGTEYELPANSFYWKIGDITDDEIVLDYFVYLRGSMEGTREAGAYPTNNYADLHYTNYLDRNAVKHTITPILPWDSATVSYGFYLVDKTTGLPIVNQTSGQTGSFANAVKMTSAVVYDEIPLNSSGEVDSTVVAGDVLPEGYSLYDPDADYTITINSGATGSWAITKGDGKIASTYVTSYGGDPTTKLTENSNTYDYTHTVVWFAIQFDPCAVPDVVVIDYGLYVDINVLANDMFGDYGTLVGIGAAKPEGVFTAELDPSFGSTLALEHGYATFNAKDGTVRYTPTDMLLDQPAVFAYAVKYTSGTVTRYFYNTITVVPAANMFYEESFVDFGGDWIDVGTSDNKDQSEDRPGTYTLAAYDANNVYGYDPTYSAYTDYSYGAAKKITVNTTEGKAGSTIPTATFTFTGTGFDLISRTSSTDGLIVLQVYSGTEATGEPVEKWAVDNYFGYTATVSDEYPWVKLTYTYHADGAEWTVKAESAQEHGTDEARPTNPSDGDTYVTYRQNYIWVKTTTEDNSLYEIPVIRKTDLAYGTYTVVVTPVYFSLFDHTKAGQYDFIFDAVRVYKPAQDIDETYYTQDHEGWPEFVHTRNNLLGQNAFSNSEAVTGAVFIDGFDVTGDIGQYDEFGPNNEIYLRRNQAVAFMLSNEDADKIDTVQIGLKSLRGETANAQIAGLNDAGGTVERVFTISTSAEMFYDITNCVSWSSGDSNLVVIRNSTDSILSVTNIKITYKEDPAAPATKMKMSHESARTAAAYVQNAAASKAGVCSHSYAIKVTAAPTATACGEAIVACGTCDFRQTVELPALGADYTEQLVKEPTCTIDGLKTYTLTLAPYGDAVVFEKIAARGHVFDEAAAPVVDEDGYARRACTVCGLTLVDEDFIDPESGSLKIKSATLHLDQNINVIFSAEVPAEFGTPYMTFTMNGTSQTVTDYFINEQGRYCFEFTNVTPQLMGDSITAVLGASGTNETNAIDYSVRQYCVSMLGKTDDEALITLLSDLLVYGAESQKYCGYRTDALVTDGLELMPGSYAPAESTISLEGERNDFADWSAASLILSNSLAIRFTFVAEDVDDLTVRVSVNGREKLYMAEDFEPVSENVWCIDFRGILATEFDDTVCAAFFREDTQIGRAVNYSVNTYITSAWQNEQLGSLVQALYNYGMSASAYAGSRD